MSLSDRSPVRSGVLVASALSLALSPAWAQIPDDSPVAEHLRQAEAAVQAVAAVPAQQRTFDSTFGALDDLVAHLQHDTAMTQFMAYVSTDAAERERGQRAEEDVANWLIGVYKREDLFQALREFADTNPQLEPDQKKLVDDTLRDFRRGGMALPPEQREELKRIQMQINKLGIEFEKNIREDETRVPLTRAELSGLPEDFFANPDLKRSGELYLVGMDNPTFEPLLDYCTNETTRKKVWLAFKRRGGKQNVRLLEQILKLRAEAAQILGYAHPADYEIEVRMARNADRVRKFYDELRPLVRTKAQKDYAEFLAEKRELTGDPQTKLCPWDQMFIQKRLMKTRYEVDAEKVREYFPLERVIDGLFTITQTLYGLEYRDVTAQAGAKGRPLWHEEVRLFEVYDKASGQLLGAFYIDLHPRDGKYTHAAQWGLYEHKVWPDGTRTRPLAALVCNFTRPTADKPSLMRHDEVKTFFHEFGHCLHSILTGTRYYLIANVARDFVEAPSQMFENWVWDAGVLKTFARHYQTGRPIPDELVAGMIRARNLGSGLYWEHQFYYGLADLAYHTAPGGVVDTTKVGLDLFGEVELYEPVPESYFQAAFGHLVGYQAGYYGYAWSRVFAEDMFHRFRQRGLLNPEAGLYYRQKILSRGGSMDEMDMLRDYLGREPKMDAFLEHIGLTSDGSPAAGTAHGSDAP